MIGPMVKRMQGDRAVGRKPASRGAVRVAPPAPRKPLRLRFSLPSPAPLLARARELLWPLLLVLLGAGLYELGTRLWPLADRPVSLISVQGELQYIDRDAMQQVIQPYLDSRFLTLDLQALQSSLAEMPWVAAVSVQRIWPDQLVIRIDEHLPVARWGDAALLNNVGVTFTPGDISEFAELPRLDGPQRNKRKVMQQYQELNRMLRSHGHSIAALELRERGSWFLTTQDGISMLFGRDQLVDKLQRFLTIDQHLLAERREYIAQVDLRYSNGMAVTWRTPATADNQSGE